MMDSKYLKEWMWVCNGCEVKIVSSVQPQCWTCREMMRNITHKEMREWFEERSLEQLS